MSKETGQGGPGEEPTYQKNAQPKEQLDFHGESGTLPSHSKAQGEQTDLNASSITIANSESPEAGFKGKFLIEDPPKKRRRRGGAACTGVLVYGENDGTRTSETKKP